MSAGCINPDFDKSEKNHAARRGRDAFGTATRISASLFRRLSAFFGSTPDQAPKAAKLAVLIPGPGMLVNVRNAPRVVIPPPPRTFRKYCAQSEKKQHHQVANRSRSPAGPRRLGTATRISASLSRRLFAFFGSTLDQAPKAAKYAVLIPGPGMLVNVRNVPRVVIAPNPKCALFRRVSRCVRSFSESRVCTHFYP